MERTPNELIMETIQRLYRLCEFEGEVEETAEGVTVALGKIANYVFQLKGQLEKTASQRNEARRDVQKVLAIAAQLQRKEMSVEGVVGQPQVPVASDGGPDEPDMYDDY
jgi:hypothetical protein